MPENVPIKIHITGKSAYPGDLPNSYVLTSEPQPGLLQKVVGKIGEVFETLLPDRGGKATTTDTSLIIKTSPTIFGYELFRMEWDRRSILREMDMLMKTDTRIKRANRVFASTAIRKGITVTVTSDVSESIAKKAQLVVDQIMRDAQINSKLSSWARILLKDGDLFLNPVIDIKTKQIKNIKRLPAISMQRNDDMMASFQDMGAAFRQVDPISLLIIQEFPLWAVNHIRWDHEEGDRYGSSQYLQCRSYWKKLNMTEEDLVIRRRVRAPLRRLHNVGTPENPGTPDQVENYKTSNQLDPRKAQVATDYYGNGLVDIKTLDADAQLNHIEDVVHLQEVYMIGTGVPLHILGFGTNVNRDIVGDQLKQFREDTQELRNLIEYGDSSPYSGIRFIFDFGLSLQGIDPMMIDYNIRWYENDNETANDRVDRVVKLRSAQPKPLISQKTAISVIAKDIGLENDTTIEAEMELIEEGLAQDREDQQSLETAINPEKPATSPASHAAAKVAVDAVMGRKSFPLHSTSVGKLEKQVANEIRQHFGAVMEAMRPEIKRLGKKYEHFTDHKKLIISDILDAFKDAAAEQKDDRIKSYVKIYDKIATQGKKAALKSEVMTDSPDTSYYFETQAGERIKDVDLTTLTELRKTLTKAYDRGEPWSSWESRIEKVMNCDAPSGRAETIARTELAWGYSRGLILGYQEIGKSRVEWLAVMDNRTCPTCRSRNGETYSLEWAENNLPAHPRCRCTVVAAD